MPPCEGVASQSTKHPRRAHQAQEEGNLVEVNPVEESLAPGLAVVERPEPVEVHIQSFQRLLNPLEKAKEAEAVESLAAVAPVEGQVEAGQQDHRE